MEDTIIPQEIYIGIDGKEYKIYPMKLKDYPKIERCFRRINDEYLYLNLPTPKLDENGNIILDKKGNPVMDCTSYNAMMTIFETALKLPRKKIEEIVDLSNGVKILDAFRCISGLKKKIQQRMVREILQNSSQV